ncbi:MAG: radical SAM protein [Candidatus Woesearchaeota archaeon]|nr:radical SAM protein [Candidatus Woesearchaeota archaeon]
MSSSHSALIQSQFLILELLAKGKNPKAIAQFSRDLISNIYPTEGENAPPGSELGLSVNDVCNLRCGHCYYSSTHQAGSKESKETNVLDLRDWKKVLDQALPLGFCHISIVGKEPLLSPDITFGIFSHLEEKRGEFQDIRLELITNGTLIACNKERLAELPQMDFFSVSLDGYREDHDSIRGKGMYQKSLEGLRIAADIGVRNLTVITTAMPQNIGSLERMMEDIADRGVEYLTIGFCFETAYNNPSLVANSQVFYEVLKKVRGAPKGLDITLGLTGSDHANLIADLFRTGFIQKGHLAVTEDLAPALIIPLNDDPRTAVQIAMLPMMFYEGFRIDYNGAVIDFCEDLRKPETKAGFGNVKKYSVLQSYQTAKALWPSYTERYYERFAAAFRSEPLSNLKAWYDHK